MENQRLRIDVGIEYVEFGKHPNVIIDVWVPEEVSGDGKAGTWRMAEHLSIVPPRIMEKVPPGELDPRD